MIDSRGCWLGVSSTGTTNCLRGFGHLGTVIGESGTKYGRRPTTVSWWGPRTWLSSHAYCFVKVVENDDVMKTPRPVCNRHYTNFSNIKQNIARVITSTVAQHFSVKLQLVTGKPYSPWCCSSWFKFRWRRLILNVTGKTNECDLQMQGFALVAENWNPLQQNHKNLQQIERSRTLTTMRRILVLHSQLQHLRLTKNQGHCCTVLLISYLLYA